MARAIQNVAVVSLATLLSRVLGLGRDIALFAVLGASAWSSAFLFAFTVPNLFRRLLGEGALTSALVPVLSEVREAQGREPAFRFLNVLLTRLLTVLGGLALGGMALMALLRFYPGEGQRWDLASTLGVILMPYVILVCLAAVFAAALNVLERFLVAALSAVWLNLSLLASLLVAAPLRVEGPSGIVYVLCGGVLVGGLLQLAIPLAALRREGWRIRPAWRGDERLRELRALLVPGLAGAGILQLNIMVSRVLAFEVNAEAVSILYLANRLVELPMGMFTIAITTVFFPALARAAVKRDEPAMEANFAQGLRLILAITLPASAGLFVLAEPILRVLFTWGRFGEADLAQTVPVLGIFALTVPFYSLATYATRCFHALKNTRTPVRLAGLAFVLNLVLSLALMFPLGTAGLALANLLSVIVQSLYLFLILRRRCPAFAKARFGWTFAKVCLAATLMGLGVLGGLGGISALGLAVKEEAALALVALIPLGAAAYAALLFVLRFEDRAEFLGMVARLPRRDRG